MQIIVGLGNPGKEFEHTYHNAGMLALEAIIAAATHENTLDKEDKGKKNAQDNVVAFKKYKSLFEYAEIGGTVFIQPLTYMNESGIAVRAALKKLNVPIKDLPKTLVVIHDDSDITIGNVKISFGRNAGGHKGVQSAIDALHTNEFYRIRIGIRPPRETTGEAKRKKAGEFALKKITAAHQKIFAEVFAKISKDLENVPPLNVLPPIDK